MMTDDELAQFGADIIELLNIEPAKGFPDRVNTTGGTKTPLGLGRTIIRILNERKEISCKNN